MAKLPYMQFYPGDWLLDTHVLSPATRGIWIDILCLMWREEPRTGTVEYTASGWCKRLRCSDAEFRTAVVEMEAENVCKILKDECKDSVRFTSRRMSREEKLRKSNRLYVSKYRSKTACKDSVSDLKDDCKGENQNQNQNQSHISESESELREEKKKKEKTPLPPKGGVVVLGVTVSDVVALWNSFPSLVKVQSVTGPFSKTLARRIQEHPRLEWFETLFQRVSDSDFLSGRKTDFSAPLDWVLGPKNLAKILAGNYDNRTNISDPNGMLSGMQAFLERHQ